MCVGKFLAPRGSHADLSFYPFRCAVTRMQTAEEIAVHCLGIRVMLHHSLHQEKQAYMRKQGRTCFGLQDKRRMSVLSPTFSSACVPDVPSGTNAVAFVIRLKRGRSGGKGQHRQPHQIDLHERTALMRFPSRAAYFPSFILTRSAHSTDYEVAVQCDQLDSNSAITHSSGWTRIPSADFSTHDLL